jgi:hypothetical protein
MKVYVPSGVVGEIAKLPVLSWLSVKVMKAVGVAESESVAIGEASIVTVQVSAIPWMAV